MMQLMHVECADLGSLQSCALEALLGPGGELRTWCCWLGSDHGCAVGGCLAQDDWLLSSGLVAARLRMLAVHLVRCLAQMMAVHLV